MFGILKIFLAILVSHICIARFGEWVAPDTIFSMVLLFFFWFVFMPLFLLSAVIAKAASTVNAADKISRSTKL